MAEAGKLRAEKHLKRALPLLERAVEVLDSSMGKGSVLAEGACVRAVFVTGGREGRFL